MAYTPQPINTEGIVLSNDLLELSEKLAENAHDLWAMKRFSEGWHYGKSRKGKKQEHPNLIPYHELPEDEKAYDRIIIIETFKALIALGYTIERA